MFGREKYRRLFGFVHRPDISFALELLLLAPLVLGVEEPGIGSFYLFISPWLLLALVALNLPLALALSMLRVDLATRRNHALEHATIHFLWQKGLRRTAGKAEVDGFRVSGGASPEQIRSAFGQVQALVRAGQPIPHVSRHCGSNRVTAQGLAIALLMLVTLASVAFRPPLLARALGLLSVIAVFVLLRHAVGNRIQARFFMATDFSEVAVHDVSKVKASLVEAPPVYFVETLVRVVGATDAGSGPGVFARP